MIQSCLQKTIPNFLKKSETLRAFKPIFLTSRKKTDLPLIYCYITEELRKRLDNLQSKVDTCSVTILLAIALALQSFLNGCADACAASILAILSAIALAQFKYSRLGMIVFKSNVIKVKKKTFTRYIGVAKIFDWRVGPNRKSHAMTLSKFFEKRDFLWNKDNVKWRIRSGGLGWHGTWILLKMDDLNKKFKKFPKIV